MSLSPLRVVTPFRPFPPESDEHLALGAFDWIDAIRMLSASVKVSCECETRVITDHDTELPVRAFHYETLERRLMLWILEVALCYLDSTDFDRDTVMVCPDMLVYRDLRPWFAGDIGIVIRPDHVRPILNSVQWWPRARKMELISFYQRILKIARDLPEDFQRWGADSEPFRLVCEPLRPGLRRRKHWIVNMIDHHEVMEALSAESIEALKDGESVSPRRTVVDFRYLRKLHMRAFFNATIGSQVKA